MVDGDAQPGHNKADRWLRATGVWVRIPGGACRRSTKFVGCLAVSDIDTATARRYPGKALPSAGLCTGRSRV